MDLKKLQSRKEVRYYEMVDLEGLLHAFLNSIVTLNFFYTETCFGDTNMGCSNKGLRRRTKH